MKSKVLFSTAVVALLCIQQLAAQDVSGVLQSKEKRQILYFSIINDDELFFEFMESTKASGRAKDGIIALNEKQAEKEQIAEGLVSEIPENELMMDQMVSLMKEFVNRDPALQRVIDERYPQVGEVLRKN